MKSVVSPEAAVAAIADGASVMVAGFMCCGNPYRLIDALIAQGTRELTLISNDAGFPGRGVGKLVSDGRVRRLVASHIGTNPLAGRGMHDGSLEVELVPQGSLVERIRCAGAGLGGVLTPTGVGTACAEGKRRLRVSGRTFLLETPLSADFALVKAAVCDRLGNAHVAKAGKNFGVAMAMAARHTIVEAEKVVEPGELDPELVTIPGIFVSTVAWAGAA